MTYKNQSVGIKILVISALIPSAYLLGVSIFLLIPALIDNFEYNSFIKTIVLLASIICGILGFIAFILQLTNKPIYKLKVLLNILSLIGYFSFVTILNGIQGWKNMLESLKNFEENVVDFYMVQWPIIVTIIVLIYNLSLLKRKNSESKIEI